MSEDTAADTADVREQAPVTAPADVVGSIRRYLAAEDGSAKAVLQPAGEAGVRITLVGEKNGLLGDRVVANLDVANAVVDAVDGLEIAEWDRDLTAKAEVSPSHWRKMAGWVAHQKHFPKARNSKILD